MVKKPECGSSVGEICMTESKVWKLVTKFLIGKGANVLCGSPPGATSYAFKNCQLIGDGKVDSPDLMFLFEGFLYVGECKGNLNDLYKININGETDFDKLNRIHVQYDLHSYTQQLIKNYDCNTEKIRGIKKLVCYSSDQVATIDNNFESIVVTESGVISSF